MGAEVNKRPWTSKAPPDAIPWVRQFTDDFRGNRDAMQALGFCAEMGARSYDDVTPEMLEAVLSAHPQTGAIRSGFKALCMSPFVREDTKDVAEHKHHIRMERVHKTSWDTVIESVPYDRRPLALELCDAWLCTHRPKKHSVEIGAKRGIIAMLQVTSAMTVTDLASEWFNYDLISAMRETDVFKRLLPGQPSISVECAKKALMAALHPEKYRDPNYDDPLYNHWVNIISQTEMYCALGRDSKRLILRMGKRVIPPQAKDWKEITQGRITEVIRQVRFGPQSVGRKREYDVALRRVLFSMPLPSNIDLSRFWEPRQARLANIDSRVDHYALKEGVILPSGELDPLFFKEEPMLDMSNTSDGLNHGNDGLSGSDYISQKALIKEQSKWASEHPGLFTARHKECYTPEQDKIIGECCHKAKGVTIYHRDISRCAFSRLVMLLEECELPEVEHERYDLYHKMFRVIDDAVCDASIELTKESSKKKVA